MVQSASSSVAYHNVLSFLNYNLNFFCYLLEITSRDKSNVNNILSMYIPMDQPYYVRFYNIFAVFVDPMSDSFDDCPFQRFNEQGGGVGGGRRLTLLM